MGALLVSGALAAGTGSAPAWASLTAAQQRALAPLQRDWPSIEPNRKQKWLEVAARFPAIPAEERARMQARMAEWARLTPAERADARLQYQQVRQLPAQERQARWEAYKALPEDERERLARADKRAAKPAPEPGVRARALPEAGTGKRNLVVPTSVPQSRPVAPTVVQAKPGATTTTMSMRATPPSHNQAGLPKIAATPGFVDPATLLPRRGPQGAAARASVVVDEADPP
jgi:hypothetical protein